MEYRQYKLSEISGHRFSAIPQLSIFRAVACFYLWSIGMKTEEEKQHVSYLARKAISCGILTRDYCSCGSKSKSHGHHEDYNKPLQVIWVCPACHLKIHGVCLIGPDTFQPDDERFEEIESVWSQSIHIIDIRSTIHGRTDTRKRAHDRLCAY